MEMKDFYYKILLMPLIKDEEHTFTVQAGNTLLSFYKTSDQPFYHFALKIGADSFESMYRRVEQAKWFLASESGDVVIPSDLWQVDSRVYFLDPDQNVVEIISDASVPEDNLWGCVCEVGLPSSDVAALSKFLRPIMNEFKAESDRFQFYGDYNGVLVLVHDERDWYPTARQAEIHPVEVVIEGPTQLTLKHSELPYKIRQITKWSGEVR